SAGRRFLEEGHLGEFDGRGLDNNPFLHFADLNDLANHLQERGDCGETLDSGGDVRVTERDKRLFISTTISTHSHLALPQDALTCALLNCSGSFDFSPTFARIWLAICKTLG